MAGVEVAAVDRGEGAPSEAGAEGVQVVAAAAAEIEEGGETEEEGENIDGLLANWNKNCTRLSVVKEISNFISRNTSNRSCSRMYLNDVRTHEP